MFIVEKNMIPRIIRGGQEYYSAIGLKKYLQSNNKCIIANAEFCPMYIYDNKCGDFYWYKLLVADNISLSDYIHYRYGKSIDDLTTSQINLCKLLFVDSKQFGDDDIKKSIISYIDSLFTDHEIHEDVIERWRLFDAECFYFEVN